MQYNHQKNMKMQKSSINIWPFQEKFVPLQPLTRNNIAEWSSW